MVLFNSSITSVTTARSALTSPGEAITSFIGVNGICSLSGKTNILQCRRPHREPNRGRERANQKLFRATGLSVVSEAQGGKARTGAPRPTSRFCENAPPIECYRFQTV